LNAGSEKTNYPETIKVSLYWGFLENQKNYGRIILKFLLQKYCTFWTARHTQILQGTIEEKNLPDYRTYTKFRHFPGEKSASYNLEMQWAVRM
jgi:hypothetical protein